MFSHVDTDGNGKVDFEEFLRMVKCKEELRGRAEEPNTRREDGQNVRRVEEANMKRAEEANLGREDHCKHPAHSCVVGCKERGGPYLR